MGKGDLDNICLELDGYAKLYGTGLGWVSYLHILSDHRACLLCLKSMLEQPLCFSAVWSVSKSSRWSHAVVDWCCEALAATGVLSILILLRALWCFSCVAREC